MKLIMPKIGRTIIDGPASSNPTNIISIVSSFINNKDYIIYGDPGKLQYHGDWMFRHMMSGLKII